MLDRPGNLSDYLALPPQVADLHWPADVVEQWLFDHAATPHSSKTTDTSTWPRSSGRESWCLPLNLSTSQPVRVTRSSLNRWLGCIGTTLGCAPRGIRDAWEHRGTWLVPPILLSRQVLGNEERGLQVVEGRMRVGILQGRAAEALNVASRSRLGSGAIADEAGQRRRVGRRSEGQPCCSMSMGRFRSTRRSSRRGARPLCAPKRGVLRLHPDKHGLIGRPLARLESTVCSCARGGN